MDHIGENAELFALGALDEDERMRVENHARFCVPCMKLLGNAERVVSDLENAMPQRDPPARLKERLLRSARARETGELRPMWFRRSLAALILMGILTAFMGLRLLQVDRQLRKTETLVVALSNDEFGLISLRAGVSGRVLATAICEKHGNWIYLIIGKARPELALYGERNGRRELLGRAITQGEAATLFIERPGKFSALELTANGTVVAESKTHYPP